MSVMFIFIAKLHETTSRNDSHFGGEGAESPKGEVTCLSAHSYVRRTGRT